MRYYTFQNRQGKRNYGAIYNWVCLLYGAGDQRVYLRCVFCLYCLTARYTSVLLRGMCSWGGTRYRMLARGGPTARGRQTRYGMTVVCTQRRVAEEHLHWNFSTNNVGEYENPTEERLSRENARWYLRMRLREGGRGGLWSQAAARRTGSGARLWTRMRDVRAYY